MSAQTAAVDRVLSGQPPIAQRKITTAMIQWASNSDGDYRRHSLFKREVDINILQINASLYVTGKTAVDWSFG